MNGERSYRRVAVPLAIFMVVGGTILAACFRCTRIPIASPLPFVVSDTLNRQLFGLLAFTSVAIGIGLVCRNRIAWHAMLIYLGLGVALPALWVFDERTVSSTGYAVPILGSILNGALGAGLYFGICPTFARSSVSSMP